MINQLNSITPITKIGADENTQVRSNIELTGGNFQSYLESAIDYVRETDAEKVHQEYLLSTGQLDNPSTLMIASTQHEIAVELLVQLRNKALEAYSELTRISM